MNKLKTLFLSILIGSFAGAVASFAFSSPGSNQPPNGSPTFWLLNGTNMYYSNGSVGIGTNNPAETLDINSGTIVIGPNMGERMNMGGGSFGFNRKVSNGTIYSSSSYAYQVQHTGSTTAASDYLAFQTYTPSGSLVTGAALAIAGTGNVGIGTVTPSVALEVNGAVKVGGSETGNSNSDIKAYIQKIACQNRRGVWVDGSGCTEFAKYSDTAAAWPGGSCGSGYHVCTFPDLFTGGFASLRRPGYGDPGGTGYVWIGGTYQSNQDTFFYPWSLGTTLQCNAGSHYMMWMIRAAAGNTAWGCYGDSYVNVAVCCRDNQ